MEADTSVNQNPQQSLGSQGYRLPLLFQWKLTVLKTIFFKAIKILSTVASRATKILLIIGVDILVNHSFYSYQSPVNSWS